MAAHPAIGDRAALSGDLMIGDDNAALSTDGILAGPEGMVRRDIAASA